MEHRQINENYRAIAEKLIAQEPALVYIKDSRVKITYLESDSTKKRRQGKACAWRVREGGGKKPLGNHKRLHDNAFQKQSCGAFRGANKDCYVPRASARGNRAGRGRRGNIQRKKA